MSLDGRSCTFAFSRNQTFPSMAVCSPEPVVGFHKFSTGGRGRFRSILIQSGMRSNSRWTRGGETVLLLVWALCTGGGLHLLQTCDKVSRIGIMRQWMDTINDTRQDSLRQSFVTRYLLQKKIMANDMATGEALRQDTGRAPPCP